MARAYRRGKNKGARDKAIQNVGFYQKQMQDIYDKKNKQIAELEEKGSRLESDCNAYNYSQQTYQEEIKELKAENEQIKNSDTLCKLIGEQKRKITDLEAQVEKMKNCGNCKNFSPTYGLCCYSLGDEDYDCRLRKWEIKEK